MGDHSQTNHVRQVHSRSQPLLNDSSAGGESNIPFLASSLTPTAEEFKPSSSSSYYSRTNYPSTSNGAIRKNFDKFYYQDNNYYNRSYSKNYNYNNGGKSKRDYSRRKTFGNVQYESYHSSKPRNQFNHDSDFYKRNGYNSVTQTDHRNISFKSNNENISNKNCDMNSSSEYYKGNYRKKYNRNQKTNFTNSYKDNNKPKTISNSIEEKQVLQEHNKNNDKLQEASKKVSTNGNVNDRFTNVQKLNKKLENVSQKERLEELILRSLLECLVCYEKLKHRDKVWSCKQCYHVLHLHCVIKWAESSKLDTGWRCPACQNICLEVPQHYFCYCGKTKEPYSGGYLPHSCDEVCGRKGRFCNHNCTLMCHPGPCPDCDIMVTRPCNCGSTKAMIKCNSKVTIKCNAVCDKLLNCGLHKCVKLCHEGDCGKCTESVRQECYCYKQGRVTVCTADTGTAKSYSCGEKCEKLLDCGNHKCQDICHKNECKPCARSPSLISTCPCGKKKLGDSRKSCLDPIPSCEQICGKRLKCGQPSAPHECKQCCHEGDCPPCPLTTSIKCRCGTMDKEMACIKLTTRADDARCQKKCTKKRYCGKHKCNQYCCIDIEHICPLPCNRTLPCGNHRCELTCHKGRCLPCLQSSFEELYCECGSSVLMPPVPCGTKPPICSMPCSRPRPCGHEPLHSCHTGPCPPCTVLITTWCYGKHEQRTTILCNQESFSCGLACGSEMSCGRHKCNKPCHLGACPQPCKQPCVQIRPGCGHPCNLPCHEPPCPETPCRQMVKVTCQCGLRSTSKICLDLAGEYQVISMSHLVSKMEDIQRGETVDLTDLVTSKQKKNDLLKALECNDECRVVERNRRMAIALQVSGSDYQQKIIPKYSDYMRQWAKKNPAFCQYVHSKLFELVRLAKQSKQKSRSYSFETMNREKRHFVHEYCEHFGCESAAYDPEPNRNVVATASKDKSFVPSYSLMEVIQRENGQRKVPGPQQLEKGRNAVAETVSLKVHGRMNRPPTPPGEFIDYFDNPPE